MSLIMAGVLLMLGVGILLWISQRAFNRCSAAGVQEISLYGHSLLLRTIERTGRIAAWLFILSGIGGLFVFLMAAQR